jgi:hypothetical protein
MLTAMQPVTPVKSNATPPASPAPEGETPHTVTVVNWSPKKAVNSQMRVMFASEHSLKVISMGEGMTPNAAGMLTQGQSAAGGSPGTRSGSAWNAYPNSPGDGAGRRDPLDDELDPDDEGGF